MGRGLAELRKPGQHDRRAQKRAANDVKRKLRKEARARYRQVGFENMHKKTRWVKKEYANVGHLMTAGDHEALAAAGWNRVLPPDHPDYVAPNEQTV